MLLRKHIPTIYLSFLGAILFVIARLNLAVQSPWALGDWLINYQGGFIRRGLPGQAAYLLARSTHLSPIPFILAAQATLYLIIFVAVWELVRTSSLRLWVMAFLLSPATLAFPVLDPQAGFRKELLYLAALAILLLLLRPPQVSSTVLTVYLALITPILLLSHEALACFLPYLVAALVIHRTGCRRTALLLTPAILLAILSLASSATHPGNAQAAARVCASLGPQNVAFCKGSIAALAEPPARAYREVQRMIASDHPFALYTRTLLLGLLPVLLAFHAERRNPRLGYMLACATLACAISSCLFFYALDWGRWIHIHLVSLFLLFLSLEETRPNSAAQTPCEFSTRLRTIASILFLAVYATTWTLPRLPSVPLRHGYFSLFYLFAPAR